MSNAKSIAKTANYTLTISHKNITNISYATQMYVDIYLKIFSQIFNAHSVQNLSLCRNTQDDNKVVNLQMTKLKVCSNCRATCLRLDHQALCQKKTAKAPAFL